MPSISKVLDSSADSVLISVNPKAGRTSPTFKAEELKKCLLEKGYNVELGTDLSEISGKANELQKSGRLRALVGVGGDGTAAELTNRTEPGTPIILLATGTANLLSKHFRWGGTPKRLTEIISQGNLIEIDAGRANGRLFLVMVSCGFDAHTVQQVHAHREENYRKGAKKGAHISYLSYIKPIFGSIANYKFPKMQVETFSEHENTEPDATYADMTWAFVFNLNRYGWGLPLAPNALGDDGVLDLCSMKGGSLFHGMRYTAFAQCGGMHKVFSDVTLKQAKKFRISAESETPIPYQLDGDPGGELPIEIEIVEKRLTLLVLGKHGK